MLLNNSNALTNVEKSTSLKDLRTTIANAKSNIAAGKDVEISQKVHDAAVSRFWQVSASKHQAGAEVDQALWEALYAYEYLKSIENERPTRATYLRRKIKDTDILSAVSTSVLKGGKTAGLQALRDMGRLDASFEAVVVKYSGAFDAAVVAAAKKTLTDYS
ncbi:hypothetical protein [Novosphingobium sp.]|jgi:hypothetical protein|uniref:hypothetical protein n=1 Tax=Novosphingobium sp. TaxID=1874826 RepID=UPI0022BCDEF1|nr:hypothetical protein [Novosphingobium sp.]MCZ8018675.1 hypothetical protein [Novosphingobium sp.]MCZ8034680.1 hypothetical protein [Novosphingobium sp.]MCZ8052815.1 hypothetical protein [Novosphingobium sp.]MCZ8060573.1 hypothetical protein [Novosphingobium sp.]MCZ8230599.1 hypothetical protein [Novosphingobium sp.]